MPDILENLDLHLNGLSPENTVRLGNAPDLHDPIAFKHHGTIDSPRIFYQVRKKEINAASSLIIANFKTRTIKLVLFDDKPWKSTVTGKLDLHDELKDMGINAKKRYNNTELFNMLKFKAPFFVDRGQHARILSNLKQFDARIETLIQDKDNLKGSILKQKAQEITSNMDLTFAIRLPVFSHQQLDTDSQNWPDFVIDVIVSTDGNQPYFQLESEGLYHYIRTSTDECFQEEIAKFDGVFPVIKTFGDEA